MASDFVARSEAEKKKDYADEFAQTIIARLKEGTAPWQKPWTPNMDMLPQNALTGKAYSGGNRLFLALQGREDPRWLTFNQIRDAGYKLKKGSKGKPIEYYQWTAKKDRLDENGKPILGPDGKPEKEIVNLTRPIYKQYHVFNGEDIEGLPPFERKERLYDWNPIEEAEKILANSGAVIKHDQADRAFYRPSTDDIHLPPQDSFERAEMYYATALHEMGHWTGHESRLNRDILNHFGTPEYAKEELRAEIGSWMLGQELGIGHDPGQHAAYVKNWIQVLEDDPMEIVRACRDAEKIKGHLLDFNKELTKERLQEQKLAQTFEKNVDNFFEPGQQAQAQKLATEKTYLTVPYSKRFEAMEAGAVWDKAAKSWFCPAGADMTPLEKFVVKEVDIRQEDVALSVPFSEKNDAKQLGARWDGENRTWIAPAGVNIKNLEKWLPENQLQKEAQKTFERPTELDVQKEFAQKLEDMGLDLKGELPIMDGKIHKVGILDKGGKIPKGTEGRYQLFSDGRPAGWAQNHFTGQYEKLKATGYVLTPEEREKQKAVFIQKAAEKKVAREQNYDLVAEKAVNLIQGFEAPPPDFQYLVDKGIDPTNSSLVYDKKQDVLILPIQNDKNEIRGFQWINREGQKGFLSDMEMAGNYAVIGSPEQKELQKTEIVICEGYATGQTLNMATEKPVVVAMSSHNLEAVTKKIREQYPEAKITIAADNDHKKARNTGIEAADRAAASVGGGVVVKAPVLNVLEKEKGLTDFNDLAKSRGLEEVRKQLGMTKEKSKGVER